MNNVVPIRGKAGPVDYHAAIAGYETANASAIYRQAALDELEEWRARLRPGRVRRWRRWLGDRLYQLADRIGR